MAFFMHEYQHDRKQSMKESMNKSYHELVHEVKDMVSNMEMGCKYIGICGTQILCHKGKNPTEKTLVTSLI